LDLIQNFDYSHSTNDRPSLRLLIDAGVFLRIPLTAALLMSPSRRDVFDVMWSMVRQLATSLEML